MPRCGPDGRGGTDRLLTQESVDAEEWQEVHAGRLNALFPLKAWVMHGVDLRSHDPSWPASRAIQTSEPRAQAGTKVRPSLQRSSLTSIP